MSFGWRSKDKVKNLIGKKLIKIEILGHDDCLRLILENDEKVDFSAEGDCCSQSWIEHYDEVIEPSKIIEFKEVEMNPIEMKPTTKGHYEEEVTYYFYELVTDKGNYLIEMRNSSNGYYGGSLE